LQVEIIRLVLGGIKTNPPATNDAISFLVDCFLFFEVNPKETNELFLYNLPFLEACAKVTASPYLSFPSSSARFLVW